MRRLKDYSTHEWLAATPLRHRARRARNRTILWYYNQRKAERQDQLIAALRPAANGNTAVFTVAFNNSRTIEWLADGFAKYGSGALLVVCDNSPVEAARRRIEASCAARGVAYVSLPRPPLAALVLTNPPLSHGVALTWIFYNLVRPLTPRVFAFVDHDLIPLSPFNFRDCLGDRPVYGLKRDRPEFGAWYLWPGYCVFDFAATASYALDFTTDVPLNLDAGGQNWSRLYRYISPEGLRFADNWSEEIHLDGDGDATAVEMIDGWLHVGGASYRDDLHHRLDTVERVLAHLSAKPLTTATARRRR